MRLGSASFNGHISDLLIAPQGKGLAAIMRRSEKCPGFDYFIRGGKNKSNQIRV